MVDVGFESITGGDGCGDVTGASVVVGGAIGDACGDGIVEEINEEDGGSGVVDEIFGIADNLSEAGVGGVAVWSFSLESRDF